VLLKLSEMDISKQGSATYGPRVRSDRKAISSDHLPCYKFFDYVTVVLAHLFIKLPRPGGNERTFSVMSSCHLLLYYQSNHSKVEVIR